jgi:hypothetical protein
MATVCKIKCPKCLHRGPPPDNEGIILKFDSSGNSSNGRTRSDTGFSSMGYVNYEDINSDDVGTPKFSSNKDNNNDTRSRSSSSDPNNNMKFYYQCLKCLTFFDNTMEEATETKLGILNEHFANSLMAAMMEEVAYRESHRTDRTDNTESKSDLSGRQDLNNNNRHSAETAASRPNDSIDDDSYFIDSMRSINLSEEEATRDSLLRRSQPTSRNQLTTCSQSLVSIGNAVVDAPQSLSPAVVNNAPLRKWRLGKRSSVAMDARRYNVCADQFSLLVMFVLIYDCINYKGGELSTFARSFVQRIPRLARRSCRSTRYLSLRQAVTVFLPRQAELQLYPQLHEPAT